MEPSKANLDVALSDGVMRDKMIGPILPVLNVHDFDEALSVVWQYATPLTLCLFSEDTTEQRRVVEGVSFGGGY